MRYDIGRIFRRGWPLVLVSTLLGGLLGLGIAFLQPKVYTATAEDFVAVAGMNNPSGSIGTGSAFISQRVNSYGSLATSPQVLEPVIAELKLPTTVADLSKQIEAKVE